MADKHTTSDDGHGGDHGGDHGDHGGGDRHGKAGGGGSSGGAVAKVFRNPLTWAVAGAGALLVAVYAGGVPMSTVGTAPPESYDVSDAPDVVRDDVRSPEARRSTARYGARTCVSIVQRARADYGRDWERELPSKARADCGRAIQEARLADRSAPQQAAEPRGSFPGADDAGVRRIDVAYGDLDLATSEGAEQFLERLRHAAHRVCGGRPDTRDLEGRRAFKDCVQRNMDNAVAQLRAPRVTALHRRSG